MVQALSRNKINRGLDADVALDRVGEDGDVDPCRRAAAVLHLEPSYTSDVTHSDVTHACINRKFPFLPFDRDIAVQRNGTLMTDFGVCTIQKVDLSITVVSTGCT